MFIYGERTVLRPFSPEDTAHVLAWSLDPEIHRLVEGDYPRSPLDVHAWTREVQTNRQKKYYIILDRGREPIGDVELDHISWRSGEAELRIRIGEKRLWNRGYGTDSIRALLSHAFSRLNLRRIYLRVLADNRRAIGCYRKCGFKPEGMLMRNGRDGSAQKILLMSVAKADFARLAASGNGAEAAPAAGVRSSSAAG